MSPLELIKLCVMAITQAAKEQALDHVVHHKLEIDHRTQDASITVSIKSTDGTKVRTYRVAVSLLEEF